MAVRDPRELDELLSQVRFRPRSSLGAEVLGRWGRGEGPGVTPGSIRGILLLVLGVLLAGLLMFALWSKFQRVGEGRTIDHCCQDLDGGGVADDGLVIVTPNGNDVQRLVIYEDRDDTGSLTAADTVRFAREGAPSIVHHPGEDMKTFEFCCRDYDGGGLHDDALMVVASPPNRIAMAAIYERRIHQPEQPLR